MAEDKGYELFKRMAYAVFKIRGVFPNTNFSLYGCEKDRGEIRVNTDRSYVRKRDWEHVLDAIKSSKLEILDLTIVAEDKCVTLEVIVLAREE